MNYEKFNDAMCRLRQAEEDLNKALRDVYLAIYEGETLNKEEIIDKTLARITKRKESQELHVGDEIEYTYPGREPEKCIVIGLDNGIGSEKIIWTIGSDLSSGPSWFSSECYFGETYRKTGKHYDSIPLPKEDQV